MATEIDNLEDGTGAGRSLGRHFRVVSLATAVSRVTGFLRDMVNSDIFGAGWVSDSYFIAVRIPSMLRDLFAEGALSQAFVPTFTRARKEGGDGDAWQLLSEVFTLLLLVVGTLSALGILFAPALISLIARGFLQNADKFNLAVQLTRLLFPVLLFVSLAALWMGCLNARERFTASAFAPVAMNLVQILAGLYLKYFRPATDAQGELSNMYVWAAATTAGMACQWFIQMPALRSLGWRLRLAWPPRHPGVMEMVALMAPAVLSQSVLQFNFLINQFFGSYLPSGDVSCLYYGNRLMQLPYGVFGVSIATVVFPLVSRYAARGDTRSIEGALSRALEAAAFILVPATTGLILLSGPITALAFQHGRFTPEASRLVNESTSMYVFGVVFYASNKIMIPTFYALGRSRWTVVSAFTAVASDFALNLSAFLFLTDMHLRFLALPAGTNLSGIVNFSLLVVGLNRLGVRFQWGRMAREAGKTLAATAPMALAVWGIDRALAGGVMPGAKVVRVFLPILLGMAVYFLSARLLRCESLDWLRSRGKKAP